MSDRIYRLLERHQRLDDLLRRAQTTRTADPFEIVRLKKLKLAIKDRLMRLARIPAKARLNLSGGPAGTAPARPALQTS